MHTEINSRTPTCTVEDTKQHVAQGSWVPPSNSKETLGIVAHHAPVTTTSEPRMCAQSVHDMCDWISVSSVWLCWLPVPCDAATPSRNHDILFTMQLRNGHCTSVRFCFVWLVVTGSAFPHVLSPLSPWEQRSSCECPPSSPPDFPRSCN